MPLTLETEKDKGIWGMERTRIICTGLLYPFLPSVLNKYKLAICHSGGKDFVYKEKRRKTWEREREKSRSEWMMIYRFYGVKGEIG